jgi:hypothetical protein
LAFCAEQQLLYRTKMRPSNAYTSDGIVEMLTEIRQSLPKKYSKSVFSRRQRFF